MTRRKEPTVPRKKRDKDKKDKVVETPKAIKKLTPEEEIVKIIDQLAATLFELPVSGRIHQPIQKGLEQLKMHVRRILATKAVK